MGVCLLLGCAVDERKLVPLPPFEELDPSAGGGGGPSTGVTWQGCSDAAGASGDSDKVRCWSFDRDTEGFSADPGIVRAFSSDDASGDPHSGSLSVTNEDVGKDAQLMTAAAYQCITVPYADKFSLELEAFVPPQPVTGGARVELEFINIPGCQGLILGDKQVPDPTPLVWEHLTMSDVVPRGARSGLLRLLVGKYHNEAAFEARFDQIRLTFE
jgi:hypothetical protein